MRLSSALAVVVLLTLAVSGDAQAAGAYVRKEPVKEPVKASVLPPLPSLPSVSLGESFNGCGGRRVRDPGTGRCQGPADVGHH
jgi:hypothetical protein